MKQKIPRVPTSEEKKQLVDFLFTEVIWRAAVPEKVLRKEVEETVENAYIAIFDTYATSSVGYAGKVMVVVYDGSPKYTETFTWERKAVSRRR
jgi:hypothetical protein